MTLSLTRAIATAAAILAFTAMPALAEQLKFAADLKGSAESPPTDSAGTGKVDAQLDTEAKTFTWTVTYEGLTGDAAAAHFHGPADPGQNAPPVVPIEGSLASPIIGSVTLTDQQIADLKAGKWYFNIHTAKFPDGEIRGQLAAAM